MFIWVYLLAQIIGSLGSFLRPFDFQVVSSL